MVTESAKKLWKEIRNENCQLCPLHRTAQAVCLVGDGAVPASVMFVGEAPGAREDEIAKPFAGAAGRYLDSLLEEIGIDRESVFISNAVKCRPPDNRTPTRTEIKACKDYLRAEIQAVRPNIIIPLGNVALEATLGEKGIMKKRGTVITKDGITYLPTLHPAAILRNPAWESMIKSDFQRIARTIRGDDDRPKTKSYIIRSSKSLQKFLAKLVAVSTPIAFDVETWGPSEEGGLRPWQPGGIILTASFTWEPGTSYVVALEHPEVSWDIPVSTVYASLNAALADKKMVGHNVKFDMAWMRTKGVKLTSSFDTMLAHHLLDENSPHGLKFLAKKYLNADDYEANISFDVPHPLTPLAIYNGKDTDYTLRLYHVFREELKQQPRLLRLFKLLVMPACNAFVDIEANGFPVDMQRLEERHEYVLGKIREVTDELLAYVPKEHRPGANFRSPIFLGKFFFGILELPILVISPKSGKPSTAESVLLKLKHRHPAVEKLMELRKWMKFESTYTRSWLNKTHLSKKPRLFTSYKLHGTVTGRLSSDMQQVPRDILMRSIIGVPQGSDTKFIEADFSQVELRIAAMYSRDPALTRAFRNDEDPHAQTASAVTGKPIKEISKEERKMAKAVNFGFLYGMGAKKFRIYADEKYGVKVTDEEAKAYRNKFFRQYKGLLPWHERQRRLVRNYGHVVSPIGRVRHLPTILSSDEFVRAQAEREAINAPVQGLASDLTVLSMVLLNSRLDTNRAKIIGNVHDAVLFEVDNDYVATASEIIRDTMEHLPLKKYFGFEPTVPIKVDVKASDHWGE